jgi:RHS repeat-associated protein
LQQETLRLRPSGDRRCLILTGLFQNWNREYNARLGRYIESDPIGLGGGINTYLYVKADPTSLADPKGLYLPWAHNQLTYAQAKESSCLRDKASELSILVAGVDHEPGSQQPLQSHMHHMCTPGDPEWICKLKQENYAVQEFGKCDLKSLAHVLHQVQDGFAPGHKNGKSWRGMPDESGGETYWSAIKHALGDLRPLGPDAAKATRETMNERCRVCGECPK